MSRLDMAEYYASKRSNVKVNVVQNLLERDRRSSEKDYSTLLNALSFRIDTLGIRSPTRLSSNSFWDEYLKTERQLKAEKKRAASAALVRDQNRNKMTPAATKVTNLYSDSDSDDNSDDAFSDSDSDEKPRKGRNVVPASAPAGGRNTAVSEKGKPKTAGGGGNVGYSLDDPEFDDEHKRRLRENCMSVISTDRPDSRIKSHPFLKKMLLAKIEPPQTVEDANTIAMYKKKAERAAKLQKEQEELEKTARAAGITTEEPQQQKQQNKGQTKPEPLNRSSLLKSRMMEEGKKRQQVQFINPIFLDEQKGQELYRILIQQEIKWTRQAVSEASRRNRLSSKKEFAFFP